MSSPDILPTPRRTSIPARARRDLSEKYLASTISIQDDVARASEAIRSFQKLREFLSVYMFQAWFDAYVENAVYTDLCDAPSAGPEASEIPSEATMLRLLSDTTEEEHERRAFDYGVFKLLWPRRNTSALDDMTRLVMTLAALLARDGCRAAHLHVDLVYQARAGSRDAPERRSHVAALRYRDRLRAASQIAYILVMDV